MPPLDNNKLKKILKRINANPRLKANSKSYWKTLVTFLGNNFGIKLEAGLRVGTIGKDTDTNTSDFDIIFTPSPYKEQEVLYPAIIKKFQETYPNESIEQHDNSLQLRYKNGVKIDLFSIAEEAFEKEKEQLVDTRQISQNILNAVKLVKYAIDSARFGDQIRGSLVESIAININPPELSICVETILNQMRKKKLATLKTYKHIRGLLE